MSIALLAASCSSDGEGTAADPGAGATTTSVVADVDTASTEAGGTPEDEANTDTTVLEDTVAAEFMVRAAAEQVSVVGAVPGSELQLKGPEVTELGMADELGNFVFRRIPPGRPYTVTDISITPPQQSESFTIAEFDDHPDQAFYDDQNLQPGLNYIEMRDGTTLAAMVRLPGPLEEGPYPTVVEYSGYDPANPDSPQPSTSIYMNLGYATVGINMRGSGCSGGAFDYFEELQAVDGYDAIEVVGAQPWVYNNHVGMIGISYPGISQLFVAAKQPPSLAAISPLSVIEDSYRSVIYPGGIYNNGFAKTWGDERQASTAAGGQEWAQQRIDAGDETCTENQLLRSQNVDLAAQAIAGEFYDPGLWDHLAPRTLVDQIEVPVFLAGAFQDEQTGPRFATMLDEFTAAPVFKATLYNGAHGDSAAPEILQRWIEFMDVYVAERAPVLDPIVRLGAPGLYLQAFGEEGLEVPPDRFDSLDAAKEAIESEPAIRVLVEMGGNPQSIGGPLSRGEWLFDAWPPPDATLQTWYLGDGSLDDEPADGTEATDSFEVDTERGQIVTPAADDDGNEFDNLAWEPIVEGDALVYESNELESDLIVAGSGMANLWISSSAADADLQVTITEVRPDGQEMYVQSGWLRASHRTLDAAESTASGPFHTHAEVDLEDLPADAATEVAIEIFPFAHSFRAGSRLRFIIDTPGGNRNLWKFDLLDLDGERHQVYRSALEPSSISLPVVSSVEAPLGLPPCPNTRSQPCRPYAALENSGL